MSVLLGKTTYRRGLTKIQTQPSEADLSIQFIKPFLSFNGFGFRANFNTSSGHPSSFPAKVTLSGDLAHLALSSRISLQKSC